MTKQTADLTVVSNELDTYDLSKPSSLVNLAGSMQKYIEEQKLFSLIQGKKFPNVEAWQFAGMSLGILPVLETVTNLSRYAKDTTETDEYKYEATVMLERAQTGQVVGRGTSVCSNKEKTKKYFEEYAIQSMAETRAVGKAYRMMLSFLMKSAGFEATPSDEMPDPAADKLEAIIALTKVASREALNEAYRFHKERFGADLDFVRLVKIMGEKFPKVENVPA